MKMTITIQVTCSICKKSEVESKRKWDLYDEADIAAATAEAIMRRTLTQIAQPVKCDECKAKA